MHRIRYLLIPAVAALLFGVGGTAQAGSFKLYIESPGAYGFKSGHRHYGYKSHYPRRHAYKRYYRSYPRYWHGGHHYGHYKPRFRHPGHRYGHYKPWFRHPGRHYGHKYRHRGPRHGYRGHRRHGWRH